MYSGENMQMLSLFICATIYKNETLAEVIMQEAKVSLSVALYYIKNQLTNENVNVSIDGAHIKIKDTIYFDIYGFLNENLCHKIDGSIDSWQGVYEVEGYTPRLIISSTPGIGDVNIVSLEGKHIYVESKKGKDKNRSNSEYPLMREAIGQLMTGCELNEQLIPVVAVPYSEKSFELAHRWSQFKQIQTLGIKFMLVHEDGNVEHI